MTPPNAGPIVLPALRGIMGNRAYYSCLMTLRELATRVNYAKEIHANESLSDMIQKALEDKRSKEIAAYLQDNSDRFFNSLVVAVYDGEPNWHPLSNVKSRYGADTTLELSEETIESVGFLTLRGDEKLFALDGQHRLAGIKRAIRGRMTDPEDEVSVIFLGHKSTTDGLEATRRLFTTLNKTARPVSKNAVIALDEDDVMAICVRRLIEDSRFFHGGNAAFIASSNMPVSNRHSLTTIGNLYDVLGILFSIAKTELRATRARLKKERPTDTQLSRYAAFAMRFFETSETHMEELHEYFRSAEKEPVVAKYRGRHGGSVLFRPVGLEIFTHVVARLTSNLSFEEAMRRASLLPRTLSEAPYADLMWDGNRGTVSSTHKVLIRDLLLHMAGAGSTAFRDKLRERYRRVLGSEDAALPPPIGDEEPV